MMKNRKSVTLVSLCFFFILGCNPKGYQTLELEINVIEDYCEGRRPSPEEELREEEPLTNQTVFLIHAEDTMAVITNDEGTIEASLPMGKYSAFTQYKLDARLKGGDTLACRQWKKTPDFIFEVSKNGEQKEQVSFRKRCNPCVPPRP